MNITKAIIPVAGYGTRRLPVTKSIEKCMLPVGNRPTVDYVVEDCIRAGITDIYFVVGEESDQLMKYYGRNIWLEQYLEKNGKTEALAQIQPRTDVNFHFVTQPQNGKYGTAIPVALVLEQIGFGVPVVVLMGDDFIYNRDGNSEVLNLLTDLNDDEAAMLGVTVDQREVEKYGVIEADTNNKFVRIVERPTVDEAPSNLINVSKYVMPPKLLRKVYDFAQISGHDGEYYITDPINDFVASGGVMRVVPALGQYLDGGNLAGWLHANEIVGKDLLSQ